MRNNLLKARLAMGLNARGRKEAVRFFLTGTGDRPDWRGGYTVRRVVTDGVNSAGAIIARGATPYLALVRAGRPTEGAPRASWSVIDQEC